MLLEASLCALLVGRVSGGGPAYHGRAFNFLFPSFHSPPQKITV